MNRDTCFFREYYAHIHMCPSVFDFGAYRSTDEKVKLALRSRVGLKVILLSVICDGRRYAFWIAHSGEARPSNLRSPCWLASAVIIIMSGNIRSRRSRHHRRHQSQRFLLHQAI